MLKFRLKIEDSLPAKLTDSLGLLLIAFQSLEETVGRVGSVALQPVDPLELWPMMSRREPREQAKALLGAVDRASSKYGVKTVPYSFPFDSTFKLKKPAAQEAAERPFAAMRMALSKTVELIDIRNQLFHGALRVDDKGALFVPPGKDKNSKPLAATVKDLEKVRRDVIGTIMFLTMATQSFRVALEHLVISKSLHRRQSE